MYPQDIEYFSGFLKEFQKESDRGAALVGAALLDARLERLLLSHLIPGKVSTELIEGSGSAPLGSFSTRTNICFALGLITDQERIELNNIRKIRNEFAHREHGMDFNDPKISALCNSLVSRHSKDDPTAPQLDSRGRFTDAVVFTSLGLWYRPEYASKYKAQQRHWPHGGE